MICFCFDRDETVDVNKGPIPISLVKRLKEQGHVVVAVGNQLLAQEAEIEGISEGTKGEKLQIARQRHPNCQAYYVIDDSQIIAQGYTYLTPKQFLLMFEQTSQKAPEEGV